ncbi:glycosyltransferase [Microbacterium marmarense]|uniref:Glycosyltransferase n=1 Tax=Microbacterium marmarense TaxID=3122051 RepID=A0ABU8LR30_9MICO
MTTGRDVVFTFSYETYADAEARGMMRPPDRILQTLLNADEVAGLLVANPYRSIPSVLRAGFSPETGPRFAASKRGALITPARMRRADPTKLGAIVGEYRRYDSVLKRRSEQLGLRVPVIVTANPLVAAFCPFAWASSVLYFGRDDWLSSTSRQEYWPAYQMAYQQIRESEIAVAAVSQQIIDRIRPLGPSMVVPNGVSPAEWLAPLPPEPEWLAALPKPRAVYAGTIDQRLDTDAVAALAHSRPDMHFILLGPSPDPDYVSQLRELANVHVHGGVGRDELVATLRNCQLSLLAHRRTALTEAMSPLKIYEYLAAGLPVVSIDLPPVRGINDRVLVAPTAAGMGPLIDRALEIGPMSEAERRDFVSEHSWESRHRVILDLLMRSPLLHRSEVFRR